MRLGKLVKNSKRRDPRYFLTEELQIQEQETEQEFLKRFEKVVGEIPDDEFLEMVLSEQDDDKPSAPVKKGKKQLYLSKEVEKYMINFMRRRIMQLLSILVRKMALAGTTASAGILPAVALPVLKVFGYGPTKLWKMTSTTGIDKIIEKFVKEHMVTASGVMYPGDTNLKNLAIAAFQEVVRVFKKDGKQIKQKMEALPEPDRAELEAQVQAELQKLGPFEVEVNQSPPEEQGEKSDGWGDWDRKRIDPERHQRSPLYQRLVNKIQGGK